MPTNRWSLIRCQSSLVNDHSERRTGHSGQLSSIPFYFRDSNSPLVTIGERKEIYPSDRIWHCSRDEFQWMTKNSVSEQNSSEECRLEDSASALWVRRTFSRCVQISLLIGCEEYEDCHLSIRLLGRCSNSVGAQRAEDLSLRLPRSCKVSTHLRVRQRNSSSFRIERTNIPYGDWIPDRRGENSWYTQPQDSIFDGCICWNNNYSFPPLLHSSIEMITVSLSSSPLIDHFILSFRVGWTNGRLAGSSDTGEPSLQLRWYGQCHKCSVRWLEQTKKRADYDQFISEQCHIPNAS